ncbi:MAG: hypothetical protein AAGK04_10125, partial [Planctomycetota bacterium]
LEGAIDLQEVRIWYDPATLLPRLAMQVDVSGDETFVRLKNIRVDNQIDDADMTLIDTDRPAPPTWAVQTHPFREPAAAIQSNAGGE